MFRRVATFRRLCRFLEAISYAFSIALVQWRLVIIFAGGARLNHDTIWGLAQVFRTRARSCGFACLLILMIYSGFQVVYMPVQMNICPDPVRGKEFYSQIDDDNITIVTMYLNLGTHKKTSFWLFTSHTYASGQYKSWLLSWGKLQNKVIAYFDDDDFVLQFRNIRSHLPKSYTKIVKVSKNELPAFQDMNKIEEILASPSFTTTYPAEYTCTMNAKYDVLDMVLKSGLIESKYVAWMDIGLWRKVQEDDPPYLLKIPPDFNSSKVGFSEVTPWSWHLNLSPKEVYQQNVVWVAGGFVLGTKPVISEFISAYRQASKELLAQGLADTDQQVIASMYTPEMAGNQKLEIMSYACPRGSFGLFGHAYMYFCLPYICRASAECKIKSFNSGSNSLYFDSRHTSANFRISKANEIH